MIVRPFLPRGFRWFFEGRLGVRGQLWYADRKLLYATIRRTRPSTVFEVGTWYGGGSTYFISQALHDNGDGVLYTSEVDAAVYQTAVENYRKHLPHLLPQVRFNLGSSTNVFPSLLKEVKTADAVFLDGLQDAEQSLDEFRLFEPFIPPGGVLVCHDWDNEKMRLVRQAISTGQGWTQKETLTSPRSVGMVVMERS